jgi:hypothetical protein
MARWLLCLRPSHFKCLIACFAICSLASLASTAQADVRINSKSKIVLLTGYSIDLVAKQELNSATRALEVLFGALQWDLQDMFNGADVKHLSERQVSERLKRRTKGGSAVSIQELFEKEGYTHLITADVQEESGSVDLQVAKLSSDGSPSQDDMQEILNITLNPGHTDVARNQILRELRAFRDVDVPRTVFIYCIKPRSPSAGTDPGMLERLLGREVTNALINFYHSPKMQERYRTVVDNFTYQWDDKDITCSSTTTSTVTSAKAREFDYFLWGVVAVSHPTGDDNFGYDKVDIEIDVQLTHPDCQRTIQIEDRLHPSQYDQKVTFATDFSHHLPEKFEPAWTDKVEHRSCTGS